MLKRLTAAPPCDLLGLVWVSRNMVGSAVHLDLLLLARHLLWRGSHCLGGGVRHHSLKDTRGRKICQLWTLTSGSLQRLVTSVEKVHDWRRIKLFFFDFCLFCGYTCTGACPSCPGGDSCPLMLLYSSRWRGFFYSNHINNKATTDLFWHDIKVYRTSQTDRSHPQTTLYFQYITFLRQIRLFTPLQLLKTLVTYYFADCRSHQSQSNTFLSQFRWWLIDGDQISK